MSTLAFLTESPTSVFIQSTDHSVILPTEDTDQDDSRQRRAERVRHCMALREIFDQHTGMPKRVSAPCNVWRECEDCGRRRKKALRERVERAVAAGSVRRVDFEPGDDGAKNVIRKYKRANVIRFPQDMGDGECHETLFVATSDDIGVPVDAAYLKKVHWFHMVMTPEGKHISGRLGALPEKEDDSPVVQRMSFVVEGIHDDLIAQAQKQAIQQTINLDPKTLEDLQKALQRREMAFVRQVTRLGGSIAFSQIMRVPVNLTLVRWKVTLPQAIRQVRSINFKTPRLHKARKHHISGDEISLQQRLAEREAFLQ